VLAALGPPAGAEATAPARSRGLDLAATPTTRPAAAPSREMPPASPPPASPPPVSAPSSNPSSNPSIARLLAHAALGEPAARVALVPLLADAYERAPSPQALADVLYWSERAWGGGDPAMLERIARFVARHCDEPGARWHWICQPGE
jgi:hypothetical protein